MYGAYTACGPTATEPFGSASYVAGGGGGSSNGHMNSGCAAAPATLSATVESYVFTVPPPPLHPPHHDPCHACTLCSTCGRGATHHHHHHLHNQMPTSIAPATTSPSQSDDDRILALQLRAAAIFNKTDVAFSLSGVPPSVPPPILNLPPPLHPLPPPTPSADTPTPPFHYPPPLPAPVNNASASTVSALTTTTHSSCDNGSLFLNYCACDNSNNSASLPSPSSSSSSSSSPQPVYVSPKPYPNIGKSATQFLTKSRLSMVSYPITSSSPSPSSSSSSCVSNVTASNTTTITTAYLQSPSSPPGMKRVSEMEGETPQKRARPAGDTELRLLIQSKAAGSVIGKGGQNISRLRSEGADHWRLRGRCTEGVG